MSCSSRRWATTGTALVAAAGVACRGYRGGADPASCEPPAAAQLSAGVSARGLVGRYRLTLSATSGPDSGSRVQGELTLAPVPLEANMHTSVALVGTAQLDLKRVGAPDVGDVGSTDPMRPGVVVLQEAGGDSPRILLRLGSEANRRDQQPFETAYTVLEVRQVSEAGFAGTWKSGVTGTVAEGYFCAILTAQSAPIPGGFDAGLH